MSEETQIEKRERWLCCRLLNAGPETDDGVWIGDGTCPITAQQAAQIYADEQMQDYRDSEQMIVAVETKPDRSLVFSCCRHVQIRVTVTFEHELTTLPAP